MSNVSKGRKNEKKPRICLWCGEWFIYIRKTQVYCSKKCSGLAKRKKQKTSCNECGEEIWRKPTEMTRREKHYCSKECANDGHAKFMRKILPKGTKNKLYITGRRYEHKTVHALFEEGYNFATRTPGSRGVFDVWGIKFFEDSIHLRLIQVKAMKGVKTALSALARKDRAIMIQGVEKNNFAWAGKMRGVPKWASTVSFELWVYDRKRGLHKFFLDVPSLEWRAREPEIIDVADTRELTP